jgi:hypothetical protein
MEAEIGNNMAGQENEKNEMFTIWKFTTFQINQSREIPENKPREISVCFS